MHMSWEHLAFLHWRVDAEALRRQLPPKLELDCFDGDAWLGVVPFLMNRVRAHGLPGIPPTNRFLELNVRTYVTCDGRPGVWFFSLDAGSRLAVGGARALFHLPYFNAAMKARLEDQVVYESQRRHAGVRGGDFSVEYEPTGAVFRSAPDSLERWLSERYCLYSADRRGKLWRGEVHHEPWPLQPGRARIHANTLGDLPGVALDGEPDNALFVRRIDVLGWALAACG